MTWYSLIVVFIAIDYITVEYCPPKWPQFVPSIFIEKVQYIAAFEKFLIAIYSVYI